LGNNFTLVEPIAEATLDVLLNPLKFDIWGCQIFHLDCMMEAAHPSYMSR
jgi:hypothetical protein